MSDKEMMEKLKTITKYFGITTEITKLSEEVGEFLGAAYKAAYTKDTNDLTDETADVLVVLMQILLYFDIDTEQIQKIMEQKINRTIDRIDKDWYKNHR